MNTTLLSNTQWPEPDLQIKQIEKISSVTSFTLPYFNFAALAFSEQNFELGSRGQSYLLLGKFTDLKVHNVLGLFFNQNEANVNWLY